MNNYKGFIGLITIMVVAYVFAPSQLTLMLLSFVVTVTIIYSIINGVKNITKEVKL